jgi:hypothetical protein
MVAPAVCKRGAGQQHAAAGGAERRKQQCNEARSRHQLSYRVGCGDTPPELEVRGAELFRAGGVVGFRGWNRVVAEW